MIRLLSYEALRQIEKILKLIQANTSDSLELVDKIAKFSKHTSFEFWESRVREILEASDQKHGQKITSKLLFIFRQVGANHQVYYDKQGNLTFNRDIVNKK